MNCELAYLLSATILSTAARWACSPLPDSSPFPDEGSGGSSQTTDLGGEEGFDPGGDDGLSDADVCEEVRIEATTIPLDMIVLRDRSASQTIDDKWGQSVGALNTFSGDPDSAPITVGLSFFAGYQPERHLQPW